jgi:tRNA-dihydrouridine synthase B
MVLIGPVSISPPFGLAPMAGMTDSAFRRLVKRRGGCGLVVTEMVSSEGLVRGIDRTLEYAEFTEEERPVSVQIFGGRPDTMAEAARVVERMGADIVDVNMGCPVPKIARHNAGCRLMREPEQAAAIVSAMVKAVGIPVTVKMRAGWNDTELNAPDLARRLEQSGAAAVFVHGRTATASYRGRSDWDLIRRVVEAVTVPVFGNGDLMEPIDLLDRWRSSGAAGVLVGRGALRNPWIYVQASDLAEGRGPRSVRPEERRSFMLDYIDLLLSERVGEPAGFRHVAPSVAGQTEQVDGRPGGRQGRRSRARDPEASRRRHVINKVRALAAWYTKGLENGSHLRQRINHVDSIAGMREAVCAFFAERPNAGDADASSP